MSLSKNDIDQYNRNGYIKIKKLFTKTARDEILYNLVFLIKSLDGSSLDFSNSDDILESDHFHKTMILLKNKKPKIFGSIYDSMTFSASLKKFAVNLPRYCLHTLVSFKKSSNKLTI